MRIVAGLFASVEQSSARTQRQPDEFLAMLVSLQVASGRVMPVGYPWIRHGAMWLIVIGIVAATFSLPLDGWGISMKISAVAGIAVLPLLFGGIRLSDIRNVGALFMPTR